MWFHARWTPSGQSANNTAKWKANPGKSGIKRNIPKELEISHAGPRNGRSCQICGVIERHHSLSKSQLCYWSAMRSLLLVMGENLQMLRRRSHQTTHHAYFRYIESNESDARNSGLAAGKCGTSCAFAGESLDITRPHSSHTDRQHMLAAAEWILRAQDASGDGGICGRYRLGAGWTSSYPETTGYLIPTLLALGEETGEERYRLSAARCIEFLLPLQLPCGGFPGLEVAENRTVPSPFNTAQIINGLIAWHSATGDERTLRAAIRAGDWLIFIQDADGAWRQYFYNQVASAYSAHLSCSLPSWGPTRENLAFSRPPKAT